MAKVCPKCGSTLIHRTAKKENMQVTNSMVAVVFRSVNILKIYR